MPQPVRSSDVRASGDLGRGSSASYSRSLTLQFAQVFVGERHVVESESRLPWQLSGQRERRGGQFRTGGRRI
jgi:hypothetical protein